MEEGEAYGRFAYVDHAMARVWFEVCEIRELYIRLFWSLVFLPWGFSLNASTHNLKAMEVFSGFQIQSTCLGS